MAYQLNNRLSFNKVLRLLHHIPIPLTLLATVVAFVVAFATSVQWANHLHRHALLFPIFASLSENVVILIITLLIVGVAIPFIVGAMAGSILSSGMVQNRYTTKITDIIKKINIYLAEKFTENRASKTFREIAKNNIYLIRWLFVLLVLLSESYGSAYILINRTAGGEWFMAVLWICCSTIYCLMAYLYRHAAGWVNFGSALFLLMITQPGAVMMFISVMTMDNAITNVTIFDLAVIIGVSIAAGLAGLYSFVVDEKRTIYNGATTILIVTVIMLAADIPQQVIINEYGGVFDKNNAAFYLNGKRMTCNRESPIYQWSGDGVTYFSCRGKEDKKSILYNGKIYKESAASLYSMLNNNSNKTNALIEKASCAQKFVNKIPPVAIANNTIILSCIDDYSWKSITNR